MKILKKLQNRSEKIAKREEINNIRNKYIKGEIN